MNASSDNNKPDLAVQFNDTTSPTPSMWDWSFVDYSNKTLVKTHFSSAQNATQLFGAGNFSITLTTSTGISTQVTFINISAGKPKLGLTLNRFRLWPADHVFNTPIDTLPIAEDSAVFTANMNDPSATLYAAPCYPINVVDDGVALSTPLVKYPEGNPSVRMPYYPVYMQPSVPAGDHAVNIINPEDNTWYNAYNWYIPRQANGTYVFTQSFSYDLSGYALDTTPGARIGIPLITVNEAATGDVMHAVPMSVSRADNSPIWPSSMGSVYNNNSYPPYGARFRLNASFDVSGYTPTQQHILNGLKKYGAIIDDSTGQDDSFLVSEEGAADGSCYASYFNGIHPSDLEMVDESSLMISMDSGRVRRT